MFPLAYAQSRFQSSMQQVDKVLTVRCSCLSMIPLFDDLGLFPVIILMNAPVPNVHLISPKYSAGFTQYKPGLKQHCPNNAAWLSAHIAVIGTATVLSFPKMEGLIVPKFPLVSSTFGNTE